ncbi:acyl-CoA dehydrogenase family protein [Cupriavidus metallidurans]|uniref:acyl-CoA dehydrogenase family protein n=1 Tax=Cupriavidus metallidurans TaxID=119219 RepID=UPI001BFC29D4|nr:acyl-CoA dehydrogenase family protein [Cupriavidus metallidurans]QWC91111.1 acyl-CoA dehydrogenase family protein [Cupriavidus metallidurans]
MNELEQMLTDSAERLFGNEVTLEQSEAMERGEFPQSLWNAVDKSGLVHVLASEEAGGANASWTEALPVMLAAGRTVTPLPFVDAATATWLLSRLGIEAPQGLLALADLSTAPTASQDGDTWRLSAEVEVPWGRHAQHVLVRAANAWLLLPTEHASVREDANIAGEPRDRLTFDDAVATAASTRQPLEGCDDPAALGALMRAIQITGVLERVLNQTVQYATERIQFGRPIGKFQAIQQQLAVLANEVVASRMAVASACAALSGKDWAQQAMIAKIICGLAAGRAPAIAHQVHGAIGFTREHSLHYATRRLWSWRAEYGSEAQWAAKLGKMAIEHGGDTLWERLTEAA